MRELIYTERQIEFAFEEHRYWDVRRWKIAPQVLDGPSHGMEITRKAHDDGSETFTYRRIEVMNHVWDDRLYWWPIPLSEISKSDALEQNPGY
ncbi:RagB/SusD family nutrient uptake outer membrane protein [Bacteroides thetaiotaomicron]|nr:RagB/SusD family nutrient uptake outer membrane protein [Bacteroides thetaiotaomicron]UVR89245.1 RagB/SusD family nutrient uptake outer membrane protein [Bacteroides thetaiotaomicron]